MIYHEESSYRANVNPYLDTTRTLYKHLISVENVAGVISPTSKAYQVFLKDSENEITYPAEASEKEFIHPQTCLLLIVDEKAKLVTKLTNIWNGQS